MRRLLAGAAIGFIMFLGLGSIGAGAATPAVRHQATSVMAQVKAMNAEIQKDEAIQPRSTGLAAITTDTTADEATLQTIKVPKGSQQQINALEHTYYKLGYDAAALEPVVGTTDAALEQTLNNQVIADESVVNADTIQVQATLNPLTLVPAAVHKAKVKHGKAVTWSNWRSAPFVINYVEPAIAVGWKILIVLTGLSVLIMLRRLVRPAHGLRP
jgi:hypothetical protein